MHVLIKSFFVLLVFAAGTADDDYIRCVLFHPLQNHTDERFYLERQGDCVFFNLLFSTFRDHHKRYSFDFEEVSEYWSQMMKHMPNPKGTGSSTMSIKMSNMAIESLGQESAFSQVFVEGYVHLSWQDTRLNYGHLPGALNITLVSARANLIWIPDIIEHFQDNYEDIHIFPNGSVEANLRFSLIQQCQMDYTNYPNDKHECCVDFISKSNPTKTVFEITDDKVRTDQAIVDPMWKIVKANAKQGKSAENGGNILKLCATVQRYSTTVVYQYSLPMAVIAIIAIVIPFFSAWLLQIGTKLLAIALFLCVENAAFDETIGFGESPPKMLVLFDFLLWTTVISLIITVVLWSLSRRRWLSVPPTIAVVIANVVNPFFWFTGDEKEQPTQLDENGIAVKKEYSPEWHNIFLAVNNISLVIFTITYLIGIIANA